MNKVLLINLITLVCVSPLYTSETAQEYTYGWRVKDWHRSAYKTDPQDYGPYYTTRQAPRTRNNIAKKFYVQDTSEQDTSLDDEELEDVPDNHSPIVDHNNITGDVKGN